jgi:hypothetical protein
LPAAPKISSRLGFMRSREAHDGQSQQQRGHDQQEEHDRQTKRLIPLSGFAARSRPNQEPPHSKTASRAKCRARRGHVPEGRHALILYRARKQIILSHDIVLKIIANDRVVFLSELG